MPPGSNPKSERQRRQRSLVQNEPPVSAHQYVSTPRGYSLANQFNRRQGSWDDERGLPEPQGNGRVERIDGMLARRDAGGTGWCSVVGGRGEARDPRDETVVEEGAVVARPGNEVEDRDEAVQAGRMTEWSLHPSNKQGSPVSSFGISSSVANNSSTETITVAGDEDVSIGGDVAKDARRCGGHDALGDGYIGGKQGKSPHEAAAAADDDNSECLGDVPKTPKGRDSAIGAVSRVELDDDRRLRKWSGESFALRVSRANSLVQCASEQSPPVNTWLSSALAGAEKSGSERSFSSPSRFDHDGHLATGIYSPFRYSGIRASAGPLPRMRGEPVSGSDRVGAAADRSQLGSSPLVIAGGSSSKSDRRRGAFVAPEPSSGRGLLSTRAQSFDENTSTSPSIPHV